MAERREHLLDAALEVLDRDGYAALTVEAVVAQVGVTRPVFYAAFENLEQFLDVLLDRTRNRALGQAMNLLDTAGDPRDVDTWLVNTVAGLIDLVQEHPQVWRPVLGITRDAPKVVRERIESTRELIHDYLTTGLEAGLQARGGPMVDPDVLARIAMVTAEEFGRLVLSYPERYRKERLVGALAAMLASAQPDVAD